MNTLLRKLTMLPSSYDEIASLIIDRVKSQWIKRSELLVVAGGVCENIYFVERGKLFGYTLKNRNEKYYTNRFFLQGDVCFFPNCFYNNEIAQEFIRASEESFIYSLSHQDLQYILFLYPEFTSILIEYLLGMYTEAQEWLFRFRMYDAPKRYEFLVKEYPHVIGAFSANHISHFINMTEVMYCRVKKKSEKL